MIERMQKYPQRNKTLKRMFHKQEGWNTYNFCASIASGTQ